MIWHQPYRTTRIHVSNTAILNNWGAKRIIKCNSARISTMITFCGCKVFLTRTTKLGNLVNLFSIARQYIADKILKEFKRKKGWFLNVFVVVVCCVAVITCMCLINICRIVRRKTKADYSKVLIPVI